MIFTVFSQYQWVFYLQLGYFISLQFIWKSSGKKTFAVKTLFPCGKWDFSTRKKAFSRERSFSTWDSSELQWAMPSCKEGVAPADAGDLLIMFSSDLSKVGCALIGSCSGPIALLKSWAHFKTEGWLVEGVLSTECQRLHFDYIEQSRTESDSLYLLINRWRFF